MEENQIESNGAMSQRNGQENERLSIPDISNNENQSNLTPRGKYNMISKETRLSIIRMYNNGITKTEIARNLDVPRTTIFGIVKNYDQTGSVASKSKGGRRNAKCTDEMRSMMSELLNEDCTRTLAYLQTRIFERFNVKLSLSAVKVNLEAINFTLKQTSAIPEARNTQDAIEKRHAYALDFDVLLGRHLMKQFIFVDEAGFNVSMRRNRGWSRRGSPANVNVSTIRSKNYSVCAAISSEGILIHEVRDKAYTGRSFANFIEDLLKKLDEMNLMNCVVVMDNATIHRVGETKRLFDNTGHTIHYLPPYSPFLNPIENCFSKWKAFVKRSSCRNESELLWAIEQGISVVSREDCAAYWRNMLFYLNKSRNREEISQ